jgi:hypothetical protein
MESASFSIFWSVLLGSYFIDSYLWPWLRLLAASKEVSNAKKPYEF